MAEQLTEQQQLIQEQYKLKQSLEKLIILCYEKAELKKFKELNFVFPDRSKSKKLLEAKLKVLHSLDVYSKTFLSIHTIAKLVLREFSEQNFKDKYLELLRLTLTLSDNIGRKKSVSVKDREEKVPHEWDSYVIGKDITIDENPIATVTVSPKTKYIKEETTGKQITKRKRKTKDLLDSCLDIEL